MIFFQFYFIIRVFRQNPVILSVLFDFLNDFDDLAWGVYLLCNLLRGLLGDQARGLLTILVLRLDNWLLDVRLFVLLVRLDASDFY